MEMVKRLSGNIFRIEPNNVKWIEEFLACVKKMKTAGCFSLCERMKGYNSHVTNSFIKNYKDFDVDLKTLVFIVDEATIAEAIGVPAEGENGLTNICLWLISTNFYCLVWKF